MIGSFSRIPYGDFAAALAPVAALGLIVALLLLALAWRSEFFTRDRLRSVVPRVRWNGALLAKSLLVALAMVLLFFLGQPPAKVAIVGGALLLVTRRIRPERVYREIDWSLLLLFAGLFIVIAGMEKAALGPEALAYARRLNLGSPPVMAARGRRALEPRQQRAVGAGAEAFRAKPRRAPHRLVDARHGGDACRQLHHPGLDRQHHRGAARAPTRASPSVSGPISKWARR